MANIDRRVTDLNSDVYYALKKVGTSQQTLTEADTLKIRQAILKDGLVDASEADLIEELQNQPDGNIQVFMGKDLQEEHLSVQCAQGNAKANLSINSWGWDRLSSRAKYVFNENVNQPWQALKDSFTFQYLPIFPKSERQANCGPASASMVLKQYGIQAPNLTNMRRLVGARTGNGDGPYALSTQQVAESVRKVAAQKGVKVNYDIKDLSSNVDSTLAAMRKELQAGKQVILLSSNLRSLGRGHYIVVKDILPNGAIVVDDPQKADGEDVIHSKNQLAAALNTRVNKWGLANAMISFDRKN